MTLDNDFIENEKLKFTDVKAKPKEDFTGMEFGRLTVICRANDYHYPNGRDKSARWHCIMLKCNTLTKELGKRNL